VQEKKPGDVYITIDVSMSTTIPPSQRKVNDTNIAAAVTSLQSTGYTVFTGGIALNSKSANSSVGVVWTSPLACGDLDMTVRGDPPCILYFRRDLEAVVEKTKQVLTLAQAIPDERVRYVDPANTRETMQELLEKSGLDIVTNGVSLLYTKQRH
jgi:hypothetical protein